MIVVAVTESKLTLRMDDEETKEKIEDAIYNVADSSEYKGKTIPGLPLKIMNIEKSSVIIHLQSSEVGNDKFIVEKGIMNDDMTKFIKNLLNNENIKMHMSPGKKYKLSVSLHSKDEQKESYSGNFCCQISISFDLNDICHIVFGYFFN